MPRRNIGRATNRERNTSKLDGGRIDLDSEGISAITRGDSPILSNHNNNSRHSQSRKLENILVIQGGGSLGAFGCGAYKALAKSGIEINIVSGTSMGAINAAIIAGSKTDSPENDLEDFWMELAESNYTMIPDIFLFNFDKEASRFLPYRLSSAGLNAALFGVPKMFVPRWQRLLIGPEFKEIGSGGDSGRGTSIYDNILPKSWTYLYDHSPLKKTLDKYIDFAKLDASSNNAQKNSTPERKTRLIITAVNVLSAEPIVLDSAKMAIQGKHLLASTAYPLYGFPWVEIDDEIYAWDGSLLDNTPLRQVIQESPRNDKNIYIVENYPRHIGCLPSNMMEVLDRTRDIIFSDKTKSSLRMSKFITRQIKLIEELYDVFETADHSKFRRGKIEHIKEEYGKLVNNYGAQILSVNRIIREETKAPHILKNADFTPREIKRLISQGEQKTLDCLQRIDTKEKNRPKNRK
ncbi:MAG TPA: patatin-like phospholipase family protein [Nitrososphaeraceae archaeon]|nr:patatin-like phospholipase family protein [Nitrososphaeraceae archaeon]